LVQSLNWECSDVDSKDKFHTKVAIEGAGIVHVITDPEEAHTDVILWRYHDGTPIECIHLNGCGGTAESAEEMHTFWSDLETLTFCVQRASFTQYFCNDEYMDRKFRELFGRPY
jgi:hypothetical protein